MTYNIKHSGQVFTPEFLVIDILDVAGYINNILDKHIVDNSCGDGAFLCKIAERYIKSGLKCGLTVDQICDGLETYIHGIEIDTETYYLCLENLNNVTATYGLRNIAWDIQNCDALSVDKYDGKMDYVVGNPPYVRVHNMEDNYNNVKEFAFARGGMTDLYLVFFELGFRMLNHRGQLCYITPISWLSSLAGCNMRKYIDKRRNLISLIDLGHFQPFNATTYTVISLFSNERRQDSFDYYVYKDGERERIHHVAQLSWSQAYINGNIYLGTPSDLVSLRLIKNSSGNIRVKNGFATLADKVFIGSSFPFNECIIPCLKASTGKWYKAFFPYDKNGNPLDYAVIFGNKSISKYLTDKKALLEKGHPRTDWYLYGRTQALRDVYHTKIAINNCIKDIGSIKLTQVEPGEGLYSGLYILSEFSYKEIEQAIMRDDFISYLKILKKYKSGGYYTFNSKDLEAYLNYKLQRC